MITLKPIALNTIFKDHHKICLGKKRRLKTEYRDRRGKIPSSQQGADAASEQQY